MLGKLFQSPLHRGNHFNEPPLETERLSLMISVPSSSGKSLQLSFFYPRAPSRNISVPSSSGKSLQRRGSSALGRDSNYFSPLFIGEITSTTSTPSEDSLKSSFQSPLHRGNHFNAVIDALKETESLFQSPLHRGNHFNRSCRASRAPSDPYFSPLFIGEITSTYCSLQHCSGHIVISVPSSSGKSLQPLSTHDRTFATQYFSPLFIGEITSTVMVLR